MSTTLPFPNPTDSGQYAEDLDVDLGASLPVAPATLAVTSAWVQSESPTFPGYNGLGTELYLPGATPDPSNNAVYDYPTLQEGLQAAVDMMEGLSPQTTALAPAFVKDVKSGTASQKQLISDVLASGWDGSGGDTYDAGAIASKLGQSGFSVGGSSSSGGSSSDAGSSTPVTTDSFDWNPLSWPGQVVGSATSSIAGDVGTYILKGMLSLVAVGLIVYGATLLTDRKSSSPAAGTGGAVAGGSSAFPGEPDPEEDFEPFEFGESGAGGAGGGEGALGDLGDAAVMA